MKSQWFFNWLECEPRGLVLFRHPLSALLVILTWLYTFDEEVLCATRLFLIKDESMILRLVLPLVVFGSAIWEELRYRPFAFHACPALAIQNCLNHCVIHILCYFRLVTRKLLSRKTFA